LQSANNSKPQFLGHNKLILMSSTCALIWYMFTCPPLADVTSTRSMLQTLCFDHIFPGLARNELTNNKQFCKRRWKSNTKSMHLPRNNSKTRQHTILGEKSRRPHHAVLTIRTMTIGSQVQRFAHSYAPSMILITPIGFPVVAIQRLITSAHLVAVLIHLVEATMSPKAIQAK
jgi:hypothetical protein